MSVTAVITTGTVDIDYPDRRIRRQQDDLDEISQTFQRSTGGLLQPGAAFPGASGYFITESTETLEVPGHFVYDVRGVGTAGGVLELPGDEQENDEGFDDASKTFITTNRNQVLIGQAMPGANGMRCVSVRRQKHPRTDTHWILTASYRGVLRGVKEPKVRWTSSGREISKEALINNFPSGWNDPRRSQILWPRQGCTISYVSLSVPNVAVPQQTGGSPHPQAPFVYTPNVSGPASEFVWQWPNGWVLLGMDVDILPSTTIAYVTENWVFNDRAVIG
jgi:hypothetical protein